MTKPGARTRVFIVDDHEIVRMGLSQFLNSTDTLTVCGQSPDASSAIAALNTAGADVVIADIGLKGTSGIDLIKAIRSRYRRLTVIALSMQTETEIVKRALAAGARGYVLKSDPVEQIPRAIESALRGHTFVSETLRERILESYLDEEEREDAPVTGLTDREFEIFKLIGQGLNRNEIARRLNIHSSTIGTYRDRIKKKLNVASSSELTRRAVQWAMKNGRE